MSSEGYHEPIELISERTRNLHRAIVTLIEELEAVDWYQQRADACSDENLRAVLIHNRNEEIEHAMMALEWLRRNDSVFAENIATYLNSTGSITASEEHHRKGSSSGPTPESVDVQTLGIAGLKERK